MNNIAHNFPSAEHSFRQQQANDLQTAAYATERLVSTRESLDTGLTIRTREGDLVTLSSSSVSSMEAYLYDGAGIARTANGEAYVAESRREITLANGQSFSFTVDGNLSDEELADIDSLLQGLDQVIAKVQSGDMDQAFDQALQLGDFDTFASFSADISYQRSYQMTSSSVATATQTLSGAADNAESSREPLSPAAGRDGAGPAMADFDRLLDRLFDRLERHREKLFDHAAKPVEKLLNHHQKWFKEESNDSPTSLSSTLQDLVNGIRSRRHGRLGRIIADHDMAKNSTERL